MERTTYKELAESWGRLATSTLPFYDDDNPGPLAYARYAAHYGLLALEAKDNAELFRNKAAEFGDLACEGILAHEPNTAYYYAEKAAHYANLALIEEMK